VYDLWFLAAVTMKNAVFWDVMPGGFCTKLRFGGTHCLHHQGEIMELGTKQ
jgi:hypothetical protein